MSVRVIEPPQPVVTPADIPGASDDDLHIAAMIAAVTAEIDGPDGWLGRAIGPQLLELSLDCWPIAPVRLLFPPLISIEKVEYTDQGEVDQTVDVDYWGKTGEFFWFGSSWARIPLGVRPNPVRIQYRAGYNGIAVSAGGTGAVPPQIKQAIILSVQHLRSISTESLFVRAEEVEDVGRTEYTVSEQAGNIIRKTCDRLLQGLRRYG